MENSNEEIWQAVLGYENYEASDLGRVRSLNYRGNTGKTKVLRPEVTSSGYLRFSLCKNGKKKSFLVQRLIYSVFKGPIPDGMHVDHVNNIKTDNRLENLQLLTPIENARKAHLGRKLTAEHRAKIRASAKARHQREKNAGKN